MTNVVLVHTDDTGRYIGPYGRSVETPALQGLADEGVLFRNAHCATPTCSPSRGALLTGSSPHSNGLVGLAHRGFEMDDYGRHLAGYLSRQGVETVLAGQQHEADPEGTTREAAASDLLGYDRVLEGDASAVDPSIDHDRTRMDLASADAAAAYLREADDPFFLSLGLWNTHKPVPLDQHTVNPAHVRPPSPLPDAPAVREEIAAFHVLVRYADECVDRVVRALRDAGRLEDTLVVFTTDHGPPFPGMKGELTEGGTGIALVVRLPEGEDARRGVAEDSLVSNVDLFPTICESLGVPVPAWVEGTSLLGLCRGEADAVREAVFGETNYHGSYYPARCVRTERYRYVRRFELDQHGRDTVDAGPSASFLDEHGCQGGPPPEEALYDYYCDAGGETNRADDPEYADVRAKLAARLDDWMERTDDPLLDGRVPAPEGADPE
ncbi:MAG: sulfatase [Halobacteriaceae archaeon]